MAQVWLITVVAPLPTPTVLLVVSQLAHSCFAEMATGLMAPSTVLSTRLVYWVVHLAQSMASAAATVATGADWDISSCAPLTWAEVLVGDQTAMATARARLVPTREVSILVFIFFIFCLV